MGKHEVALSMAGGGSHRFKPIAAAIASAVVLVLAVAVLALPVFTMGNDPQCGLEEHTHGAACYASESKLVCGLEETAGHAHSDACKNADGALVCGLPETAGHTHTDDCYLTETKLTCTLPEHHHVDACYEQAVAERSVKAAQSESANERTVAAQSLDVQPDYAFTADVPADAGIPGNAQLVTREIEPGTEEFEAYLSQAVEKLEDKGALTSCRLFDVSFVVDGQEVEPTKPVNVRMSMNTEEPEGDGLTTSVVHFADEGLEVIEPSKVQDTNAGKTEVAYTQASFSVVGIVQTSSAISFEVNQEYMFYAEGYALGVKSGSLGSYGVDVDGERVVPKDSPADINAKACSWTYTSSGAFYNSYSQMYLNLGSSNTPYVSKNQQRLYERVFGNMVRISADAKGGNNGRVYLGYSKTSNGLGLVVSGVYADGKYFAVAKVDSNYTPSGDIKGFGVVDSIEQDGCLMPDWSSANKPSGTNFTYEWDKSDDGQTWTKVDRKKVTGDSYNVAEDGSWLNVAYDKGGGKYYRVRLASIDGKAVNYASMEYKVPYYDQLQNGSFETPYIDPNAPDTYIEDYQPLVPQETSGLVWKTTASDKVIELVSTDKTKVFEKTSWGDQTFSSFSELWHHCPEAAKGQQYAELNANESGALYQDVLTTPGAKMYWQASHRGRSLDTNKGGYIGDGRTDTMYVLIMPTTLAKDITSKAKVDEVIYDVKYNGSKKYPGAQVTTCTTNNSAWKTYSDVVDIPENQYLTRFFFVAGEMGSGDITVGNHLDDVWFSEQLPDPSPDKVNLEIKKTIVGLDYDDAADLLNKMSFAIDRDTVPGSDFSSLSLNDDGSYTATYSKSYDIASGTSRTFAVSEDADTANVNDYVRTTMVFTADDTNAVAGTSASITVKGGKRGTVEFTNSYEVARGPVAFKKVDGAGAVLPNAKFGLFVDEACSTVAQDGGKELIVMSSNTGEVSFGNVKVGTYYLKEIAAPSGYKLDSTVYTVVVTKDGCTITKADGTPVTRIANQSNAVCLKLFKTDDATPANYISDARFELQKKNAAGTYEKLSFNGVQYVQVGGESGYTFGSLEEGEYRLVEILAPAGYYRITEPIDFKVAEGKLELASSSDGKPWILGQPNEVDGKLQYNLFVQNHPGKELPVTGGMGATPFIGAGLAVLGICLAGIAVAAFKRREELQCA